MALTYLTPARPERRPKAARGEWPGMATASRSEEVEGHTGDGLATLGGASTPPAARATLSANGWESDCP
jgi:hypothetical protein